MNSEEEKRLTAILNKLPIVNLKNFEEKNEAESIRSRELADGLFVNEVHNVEMHARILGMYTRSVAFALPESVPLALAYGKRAAFLMHLEKYVEALVDLDLVMTLPVDDETAVKYMCMKAECQAELGLQEAKDSCIQAHFLLNAYETADELDLRSEITGRLVRAIVKYEMEEYRGFPQIKAQYDLPNSGQITMHQSKVIPNASSVMIARCQSVDRYRYGRYLVATRNVLPGEVFYCGTPYVHFVNEIRQHTNCHYCMSFAWNGIPCDRCPTVIFCCNECKEKAHEEYHEIECKVIERSAFFGDTVRTAKLMSLRILIKALRETGSVDELKKSLKEIDEHKDPLKKGFTDGMFLPNHRSVYSLLSHSFRQVGRMSKIVSKESAILLHLLCKHTKLLPFDPDTLANNEDAIFVGKLLTHFIHVILYNGSLVKETYAPTMTPWIWESKGERDSTGMYLDPLLSLLNHSCFPNVNRCQTQDGRNILYSIRPIMKGEQLFYSYGPTFSDCEKFKRQILLDNMFFDCKCIACENDWPIYAYMHYKGLQYATTQASEINAVVKAIERADKIFHAIKDCSFNRDPEALGEIGYAIYLVVLYTKLPNWRLQCLAQLLTSAFDEIYGYNVGIPEKCLE